MWPFWRSKANSRLMFQPYSNADSISRPTRITGVTLRACRYFRRKPYTRYTVHRIVCENSGPGARAQGCGPPWAIEDASSARARSALARSRARRPACAVGREAGQ